MWGLGSSLGFACGRCVLSVVGEGLNLSWAAGCLCVRMQWCLGPLFGVKYVLSVVGVQFEREFEVVPRRRS